MITVTAKIKNHTYHIEMDSKNTNDEIKLEIEEQFGMKNLPIDIIKISNKINCNGNLD